MKPLTIQEIRQALGAKPLSAIPSGAPTITAVCTDSRRMEPASLFVALRGERFDGHEYLPVAAAGGAIAAVVEAAPDVDLPNLVLLQVENTRAALGRLARHVRQQLKTTKVIGVAGSNGKTSTKHLVQAALGGKLKGSISPRSFNNDIGVPLTIFPADPSQHYLVLEMGTNHPGEIKVLTEMALPDIAVITNCGPEHLEFLGDLMGVRRENASIIGGLNPKGLLVVNGDDPELLASVAGYKGLRITFGFQPTNDLFATDVRCTATGTTFRLNNSRREVFVPLLGRHTAANALAAIAVARRLGVDDELIVEGLAHATGPDMRLQLKTVDGITVLNDAYNANPASMRAALETVVALPANGRKIAVLGDMRELGKGSERHHRELGEFAATCRLDLLACVGTESLATADAAKRAGMPDDRVVHFPDALAASHAVPAWLGQGDLVLLKASRGIRLEQVAQAIEQRGQDMHRRVAG